ncbi:MAG: class I SAM-dependent rRNA methyltransferase [Gemmatimonadota bacterium]
MILVDLMAGQKTGAFLDQQENYRAAARHAEGAARALDAFAGDGGFALHLAAVAGGVEAVDSSAAAVARGRGNAELNGLANISWSTANAFDHLHAQDAAGERFDAIVLDPPAFARNRAALPGARRGYKEINFRALRCLAPGGVLVSCSCSYHVSREMLLEIVTEAAADAGRTVELLEWRTQAPDHPILVNVPETAYLKCLILRAR